MTSFQGYRDINRMDTFKLAHAASIIRSRPITKMRHLLLPACLVLLLAGCAVYKMEIQQGNVITQEMIDKLKPGMTRSQVRFVLGTPPVTDAFHPNRWDYYYYLRHSNEAGGETRRLTVIFKNDTLVTVQGGKPETSESQPPKS